MKQGAERARDVGPIQPAGPLRPIGPLDHWRERGKQRVPARNPAPQPPPPREEDNSTIDERA
jgi:hypothetical protein